MLFHERVSVTVPRERRSFVFGVSEPAYEFEPEVRKVPWIVATPSGEHAE